MSDKERILLTIIRELQTMLVLARGAYQLDFHDRSAGRDAPSAWKKSRLPAARSATLGGGKGARLAMLPG